MLRLANIRNGLTLPSDDYCYFQSCHGHSRKVGYFRIDAMPYRAVIELLRGGRVEILDATQHNKSLSDALKFGVPTWCLVFNRALERRDVKVCSWQTREMWEAAGDKIHKPLVQTIRKLVRVFGQAGPIEIGQQVFLVCLPNASWDDKPELINGNQLLP